MEVGGYNLVYNSMSFASATVGAATVLFFAQRSQVAPANKNEINLTEYV